MEEHFKSIHMVSESGVTLIKPEEGDKVSLDIKAKAASPKRKGIINTKCNKCAYISV